MNTSRSDVAFAFAPKTLSQRIPPTPLLFVTADTVSKLWMYEPSINIKNIKDMATRHFFVTRNPKIFLSPPQVLEFNLTSHFASSVINITVSKPRTMSRILSENRQLLYEPPMMMPTTMPAMTLTVSVAVFVQYGQVERRHIRFALLPRRPLRWRPLVVDVKETHARWILLRLVVIDVLQQVLL